jgi:hypothetical protein
MSAPTRRKKAVVNCEAKRRYSNDTQARAAAMISLERHDEGVSALWVYKCPECFGWHLTRQKGRDRFKVTINQPVY